MLCVVLRSHLTTPTEELTNVKYAKKEVELCKESQVVAIHRVVLEFGEGRPVIADSQDQPGARIAMKRIFYLPWTSW